MSSFSPMHQKTLDNDNKVLNIFNNNEESKNFLIKYMNVRRANKNLLYRKLKKIKNYQTFDNIYPNKINWKKDITKYEQEKKNLKWGRNPLVKYYSKFQFNSEGNKIFDPITQKYLDKEKEERIKNEEKTELINNISKCYDKQLSLCQSYNIINFQDKLKGFEKELNYPKSKKTQSKKVLNLSPRINYNIISNLKYNIHHYDKPENRPNVNEHINYKGKNIKTITISQSLKDYNILTNEYLNNNEYIKKIDKELNILKAAKKYYQYRKINPITGKYYDEKKEQEYLNKKELLMKKLLNKKKEMLFNPINFENSNEEQLKKDDLLNINRKARYKVRDQFDNYYRTKNNLINDEEEKKLLKRKLFYKRFKPNEERDYDIINNNRLLSLKIEDINNSDKSPWYLIKEGVNKNETISKNQDSIVRDKNDILRKFIYNKLKRTKIIKHLQRIDNDPLFIINKKEKILDNLRKSQTIKTSSFSSDKKSWFNL